MGTWIKERKPPKEYPKTEYQEAIGKAGKEIAKECTGLKKKDFYACRSKVLEELFKKENKK